MKIVYNDRMRSQQVVILEHVPNEKAGTILNFLNQEKISFREVRLFETGFELPTIDSVRALVVMGGPMNVYEEEKHPFLKGEGLFIKEAVKRNVPYLGICLGSQLLAKALGARVYKAKQPEIGWDDVRLSAEAKKDRLFGSLSGPALKVLQWHEDTFDLPADSMLLASSAVVPNQAYRHKDRFYGFQFHLEMDRPMLEDWFKNKQDLQKILDEYEAYKPRLGPITNMIYRTFFNDGGGPLPRKAGF